MTAITSAYGAADQFWHADCVSQGSTAKYVGSFVPSYSLFITLQVRYRRSEFDFTPYYDINVI